MSIVAIPISSFYEVINDSTAAVAPGDAVSFSQDGLSTGGMNNLISRVNDTTFQLAFSQSASPTPYRIVWQVGVANSGQLGVSVVAGTTTLEGVVGTSWGHSQIVGDYSLSITEDTNISIVNPSANMSSLNLLSHGSGNVDVVVTLTIFQLIMVV